jgi:DNA-directed RNA polymerase specialized sigma24 family protein
VCHIVGAESVQEEAVANNNTHPDEVKSLYQKHGAALAAYACSCGLDHASAEDVVHQLFLKMLREKTFAPQAPVAYFLNPA